MPRDWNKRPYLENSVYISCKGKIKLLEGTRAFKNTWNELHVL